MENFASLHLDVPYGDRCSGLQWSRQEKGFPHRHIRVDKEIVIPGQHGKDCSILWLHTAFFKCCAYNLLGWGRHSGHYSKGQSHMHCGLIPDVCLKVDFSTLWTIFIGFGIAILLSHCFKSNNTNLEAKNIYRT